MLPVRVGLSWHVLFHVLAAGLGMWLFVRQQTGSRVGAWLSALTFAFSGFMAARILPAMWGCWRRLPGCPWLLWAFARRVWRGAAGGRPFSPVSLSPWPS
ncbi:MAG: hypothetical protein IPJ94_25910 [Chloroflexi bacterium]|nr:hypothetical protein [Chloroflexota bacterium]